jgi:hypothetical protein
MIRIKKKPKKPTPVLPVVQKGCPADMPWGK